jgi:prevent-host-death family protein
VAIMGVFMKTYTAKDAKNRFGQLIDDVRSGPVSITRNGRNVAVMISASDAKLLDHLAQCLEEKYWSVRMTEAEKSGYLSIEESNKILQDALGDDRETSPNAVDTREKSREKFSGFYGALANISLREKIPIDQVTKIASELLNEELEDIDNFDKRKSEASITYEEFVRRLKEDALI